MNVTNDALYYWFYGFSNYQNITYIVGTVFIRRIIHV